MAAVTYKLEQVFVTGGEPTITYVVRTEKGLEDEVGSYLNTGHRVLAVSGPSKSGKSTLVNRVLRETETPYVRTTGASLKTMQDFWSIIASRASIPAAVSTSTEHSSEIGGSVSGKIGVGGFIPAELATQVQLRLANKATTSTSRVITLSESVKEALASLGICLVIDDFHYASEEVRRDLAREIKDLVFNGARVILVAIPERVMEVLQDEGELAGRIKRLRTGEWGQYELMLIANQGFGALNLRGESMGEIANTMVTQSYGSPLLMQALCEEMSRENGVLGTLPAPRALQPPDDWQEFYRRLARNMQPSVIEHLKLGPVERRRRVQKDVIGGGKVDLYSATLIAIQRMLPQRQMTPIDLSNAMADFLTTRPPIADVRRALTQMASIAIKNRGAGDAALSYSTKPERLTIVDPYLAFFAAWGLGELDLPVR